MKILPVILLLFSMFSGSDLLEAATDDFIRLDEYARKTPAHYENDLQTLANYLIIPAKSDIEKARVLFTWVATRISYDDMAYNSKNHRDDSPENVLMSRKAVCEGYSNILKKLCTLSGMHAEVVRGYSKGYGYSGQESLNQTNHSWNVIKIDNAWRLFDVTWASGYGTSKNGNLVTTSVFDPYWFDVHPKEFIFTHLPAESSWQLLKDPISLDRFRSLPILRETFFKLGFDAESVFHDAISGKIESFAETFAISFPCHAVELPYTRYLKSGRKVQFVIQSDHAEEIVLIDGTAWHSFFREGSTYSLVYAPAGKQVTICGKNDRNDKSCSTIIKYLIK